MSDGLAALEARVNNLEAGQSKLERTIAEGFSRLESLLLREIADLKKEQITRLADDQRRLWEVTRELERREYQRAGGSKAVAAITHFLSAIFGGLVAAAAALLSHGKPVP